MLIAVVIGVVVFLFLLRKLQLALRARNYRHDDKKVFFITGAAQGIGNKLVETFLRDGHTVIASDINFELLQKAAETWPSHLAFLYKLNVSNATEWESLYKTVLRKFKKIDVHMNVAGVLRPSWTYDATPEEVDLHLNVNTKGMIFGTQQAAKHMIKNGAGHIINIGSLASLGPVPGIGLYAASKYAIRGYTITAALELRKFNVAVTLVNPDAVATPMLTMQTLFPQAALTFTAPSVLSAEQVALEIRNKALVFRPFELTIPWRRGVLMRLLDMTVDNTWWLPYLVNFFFKTGLKKQEEYKKNMRNYAD